MDKGGISRRLINLANSMIGSVHGGLGYVAVIAAMFLQQFLVQEQLQ